MNNLDKIIGFLIEEAIHEYLCLFNAKHHTLAKEALKLKNDYADLDSLFEQGWTQREDVVKQALYYKNQELKKLFVEMYREDFKYGGLFYPIHDDK